MITLHSIRTALAVSAAALLGAATAALAADATAAQVADPLVTGAVAAPPAKTAKVAMAKKKKPAVQPALADPVPVPAAAVAPDAVIVPADAMAALAPPAADAATLAPLKQRTGKGTAYHDGTFQGPKVDAAWGLLQIEATVAGGQIVTLTVVPGSKGKPPGKVISALSMLKSEAIKTQKAKVHVVSGATTTSKAFMRSLAGALKQASAGG
jgi:uncharacterized protein with FMN-binding domain